MGLTHQVLYIPVNDENAHDLFSEIPGCFFLPPELEGSEKYTFGG